MNRSIFDGLALVRGVDCIEIRYPNRIHDFSRADRVAHRYHLQVARPDRDGWLLRHGVGDATGPGVLKAFFADLNGNPPPYPAVTAPMTSAARPPLVSCIVVVNENLPFVREQLLPSLVANCVPHPIEVILVCNGGASFDPGLPSVLGVASQFGAVSVAYNAGARASRGEFVAFFHDDCVIDDPLWIDKCIQRLQQGADAVSGEYREMTQIAGVKCPPLPVAKSVPLVMRAADFHQTGGFDEFHYIGYEDIDFTLALASQGRKVVMTDLRIRHFSGMSSTLKYCPVPGLRDLYALAALPRQAIVARFNEFVKQGLRVDGIDYLRAAMDVQLLYVLVKHRHLLGQMDGHAFARAETALRERIAAQGGGDERAILSRFKSIDRGYPAQARQTP